MHIQPQNTESNQQFMLDFYESHKVFLFHTARKFAQSPSDCEDLVQDALVRLLRNVETLRRLNGDQTCTYLYLTIRSAHLDRTKATQERERSVADVPLKQVSHETIQFHTEDVFNAKWDAEILKKALSTRDWQLLELKYIGGYSDQDIARELGCASGSVRTLLRRVRQRARDILDDHEKEREE